jgi:CHAD domain-containing protein
MMVRARSLPRPEPVARRGGPDALQTRVEEYLLEKLRLIFAPLRAANATGDAEVLHRMRVASRRLRVGFHTFASLFPAGDLKQLQRELRRITRLLGAVRTLDVNARLLRGATDRLPSSTRAVRATLEQHLLVERATRMVELRELLHLLETGKLDQRLEALIERRDRHLDNKRLQRDAAEQLHDLRRVLRRRHKQFLKKRSGHCFHKFRIAAKHYRYGLEAVQAVFHLPMDARIRAVERLQDLMGNCHDVELLLDHLRDAERRWGRTNNDLAKAAGKMIRFYRVEHKRQFALFEEFLDQKPPWTKKVKLRVAP